MLLSTVLDQALDYARIGKCCNIAEVAGVLFRDLAKDTTHDLTRTGLRK